jgi:hypothetical protein
MLLMLELELMLMVFGPHNDNSFFFKEDESDSSRGGKCERE